MIAPVLAMLAVAQTTHSGEKGADDDAAGTSAAPWATQQNAPETVGRGVRADR